MWVCLFKSLKPRKTMENPLKKEVDRLKGRQGSSFG